MNTIHVRTLGEFSLQYEDTNISDLGTRSKKVWSLLAYLIHHRDRTVSQQKLIQLLWGEDSSCANPENALRITLHRLRTLLNQLWPTAGRDLIISREGSYSWNTELPIEVDCDRFDTLCQSGTVDEELRLQELLEAVSLYRGPFLPRQSSEVWVVPINSYFANLYQTIALTTGKALAKRNRHAEAAEICQAAAAADPYNEPLQQLLMRELAATGDIKGAAAVYENLSRRLFDDFGIRPSEETRTVYRAVAFCPEERTLPMDEILEELHEPAGSTGALMCDYDHFRYLCFAECRSLERSGKVTHIALLRVSREDKALSKSSLDRIMQQFGDCLRNGLRRGDAVSRCSASQHVIMLPNANYENSCAVCKRLISGFHRKYPHAHVQIEYLVQPLSPTSVQMS